MNTYASPAGFPPAVVVLLIIVDVLAGLIVGGVTYVLARRDKLSGFAAVVIAAGAFSASVCLAIKIQEKFGWM